MLSRGSLLFPVVRRTAKFNKLAITAFPQAIVRGDHHAPPVVVKPPTMDDLLVPCGSWQENYDNNQRRYNIHLLLGSGFFIITLCVGYFSGAFDLYMSPPARPSPKIP